MILPDKPGTVNELGVVILGAGASRRMGRPKLLLPWQDGTVIASIIRQWQALGAAQIGLVCRPGDEALFAELDRLNFPREHRIINPNHELGMFSSIQCAAAWPGWRGGLAGWAIVLGDQPHLRTETLRTLLAYHLRHPLAICQPVQDDHGGHPVLLSRAAFQRLHNTQASTLKLFLNQNLGWVVKVPVCDPGLLLDLDIPEDYHRLTNSI